MFFDTWSGLLRVLIVGPLAYAALVLVLRISGKRTQSKVNAFDLVVTVALGSTLATIVLSKDVALFEGVVAVLLLAGCQFVIAWTSPRLRIVRRVIKAAPAILLRDGLIDRRVLLEERVTEDEVKAAIRKCGLGDLSSVAAVFLETGGSFSVIALSKAGMRSAFPSEAGGEQQPHKE